MPRPINRASDMNIMKLIDVTTPMINAALPLRSSAGRWAFAALVASPKRCTAPTSANSLNVLLAAITSQLRPAPFFTIHTCLCASGLSQPI